MEVELWEPTIDRERFHSRPWSPGKLIVDVLRQAFPELRKCQKYTSTTLLLQQAFPELQKFQKYTSATLELAEGHPTASRKTQRSTSTVDHDKTMVEHGPRFFNVWNLYLLPIFPKLTCLVLANGNFRMCGWGSLTSTHRILKVWYGRWS